jgi:hypothetical protein
MYSDPPKNWTSGMARHAEQQKVKREITKFALSFLLSNLEDIEVEDALKGLGYTAKDVEYVIKNSN